MYTNPAIDAFRIYPAGGPTRAEFSHATVSYKNTKGAISLEVEADDLHMRQLHFEIVDVQQVTHVSVGNTILSVSQSWKEMMETPNHYYYDAEANVLFTNYAHR